MSHQQENEVWFLTGSQHLYGPAALEQVQANTNAIVSHLNQDRNIPIKLVSRPILTTPEEIAAACREASASTRVIGVIVWMHTFSPSKMWIGGLRALSKPLLHLHTQFNAALPWSTIDMDFMNLNQAAHGDREHGFIHARLRLPRKVVVGHWSEANTQAKIATWVRAARAWADLQGARVVRFGDNMRYVAVTDGDKVSAEATFGFSVNTHGIGDLVEVNRGISEGEVSALVEQYASQYAVPPDLLPGGARAHALREGARIELGLRAFLTAGGYKAFTTTFEDLHGMEQLPGLAVQRLMADGYGFAGEGDWKTAALLRAVKVMTEDLPGGTSFMEDYTYDMEGPDRLVLGSHMLEVDPSISAGRPAVECHPLGIGGKADPVRLVFEAHAGQAINVSLIDLGGRFRLVLNEVDVVLPPHPLPKLPVARATWRPKPSFEVALQSWILAGGAHHTVFSYPATAEHISDFAEIAGVELIQIDDGTDIRGLKNELRHNDLYYHLAFGIGH